MAISNRYQITDESDLSPLSAENGGGPDFRARFADEKREGEGAALQRSSSGACARARSPCTTWPAILRDVGDDPDSYNIPDDELPARPCMHARRSART